MSSSYGGQGSRASGRGEPALPGSRTKLAQVMIQVQVSPTEPLLFGQGSKNGMRLKVKIFLGGRESFNQGKQLREILLEIDWTSAGLSILIDFRRRLESLGPLQWSSKRNPFDHRLIEPVGCETSGLFADGDAECIAQVADHLR